LNHSFVERVLQAAASTAANRNQIGGVAVYGVTKDWFLRQYSGFEQTHSDFKLKSFEQAVSIMEALYLLDAEDINPEFC
jgi:hypothetical protein